MASRPRPETSRKRGNVDSEDDEEGRSAAMGKQKRLRTGPAGGAVSAAAAAVEETPTVPRAAPAPGETTADDTSAPLATSSEPAPVAPAAAPSKKRSGTSSYLDQLLAERAAKKNKKRKKNKQNTGNDSKP